MPGGDKATAAEHRPFVPAHVSLPEITVKAVILGVLLSVILSSANVYLGLFAGITVSASIPAAVISMGILRLFRNRNILENNIVQTSTSAGESLAAGVLFTIPALVILGAWEDFTSHALETILIAAFAGVLGVVFTIPLRRAFIVEADLRFPEGIACAEVLEVGEEGGGGINIIALGGLVGALVKFGATGLALWKSTADYAVRVGNSIFAMGTSLSPALVAVGYIVGTNISIVVFSGGVIAWLIAIPIYTSMNGIPAGLDSPQALYGHALSPVWDEQIRYMGVGAMAVGGLYALVRLARPLVDGIKSGVSAYRASRAGTEDVRPRTERDLGPMAMLALIGVSIVPLFWIYLTFAESVPRAFLLAAVMLVIGFLFSSVAGYMAGLVGSSNNPISGVTIASTIIAGGLLWLTGIPDEIGAIGTIAVAATIASAGAIAGDNMQDLKTGYLVGATPMRQQTAQIIGVLSAALAAPFVLEVMRQSYGLCGVADADPERCLRAPQANLIGAVAGAFFGNPIPWTMAAIGAAIAIAIIAVDLVLESRRATFRMPVLAAAIGIYLPIELTASIFIGGMVHFAVVRYHRSRERLFPDRAERRSRGLRNGLLLASGLIAGEAIMGILVGIPSLFASRPGQNPLDVFPGLPMDAPIPISGMLMLLLAILLLYYVAIRPFTRDEGSGG